jgi:hypothetical protein
VLIMFVSLVLNFFDLALTTRIPQTRDDVKLDRRECFFTGSVSTLRTHISRRKGHVKVYLERCAALGIEPHPRALQRVSDPTDRLLQSSLDSIVSREPKRPPFTTRGLMDYIVQVIVCEDEVCYL